MLGRKKESDVSMYFLVFVISFESKDLCFVPGIRQLKKGVKGKDLTTFPKCEYLVCLNRVKDI